jgi:hypothetical protein
MSTAGVVLAASRALLADGPTGWRAAAVATLTRQALETGLEVYGRDVAPGTERATMHVQLLCLPSFAGPDVAGLAASTWVSLSGVVHARTYELAPTADELRQWADNVDAVLGGLTS